MDAIVEAIATDVRYWAEGRSSKEDLNGWCARASAELFKQLTSNGIPAEIHAWVDNDDEMAHVYVVVDDHVVDVTATQFRPFRNTPVVILHVKEAMAHEFWQTTAIFESVKELRSWQKRGHWPPDQVAFK
jgi:hypothetical protein